MGAWGYMRLRLAQLIDGRWPLHYIGRPRSSSPAEGSSAWHALNQEAIIKQAYDLTESRADESLVLGRPNSQALGTRDSDCRSLIVDCRLKTEDCTFSNLQSSIENRQS